MRLKIEGVKDLFVYGAWFWEPELAEQCNELFKKFARDEGDGKMFVPNLNGLLFELDMILEKWKQQSGTTVG